MWIFQKKLCTVTFEPLTNFTFMSGFWESVPNEQTNTQTDAQTDWAEYIGPFPWTRGPENPHTHKKNNQHAWSPSIDKLFNPFLKYSQFYNLLSGVSTSFFTTPTLKLLKELLASLNLYQHGKNLAILSICSRDILWFNNPPIWLVMSISAQICGTIFFSNMGFVQ